VARLVGAPPGYVGYDDGGQLTDTVRRKNYCLILLDEIEKAHPDVFNMLLQIFDDGHLTDAKGRQVSFRNTIIIMTSNVGSNLIRKESAFGFAVKSEDAQTEAQQYIRMRDKVLAETKNVFRPEFLNRVDSTLVFHTLTKEHIRKIVDLMLKEIDKQIALKGFTLDVTAKARDWLGEKGYDPVFGARPLRRVIQERMEDSLSEALLRDEFDPGDTILVDVVTEKNEEGVEDERLDYTRLPKVESDNDSASDGGDEGGDQDPDSGSGGSPTEEPVATS